MSGSLQNPGALVDRFDARRVLALASGSVVYYRLAAVAERVGVDLSRLPMTVKIVLENILRHCDGRVVHEEDVVALARWNPATNADRPFPFWPARVLLQDLTGVPAVVDLAAMRAAAARLGGDPKKVNPLIPADLVIDHSVQVDRFGSTLAFSYNREREFTRNRERYALLRWAQQAFDNFLLVPPDTGIVHQVNLEYLAKVVQRRADSDGTVVAYPDTLVGTDSHTTMVNGLGVLGWGVGGIEAEAALLGQPLEVPMPAVIGFRFTGELPEGTTATDLVLTVTEILRKKGVVGKFVEFTGPGLNQLSLADRATLGNMAPEYGATAGLFPIDAETLRYLRLTGRDEELIDLVERYAKEQGMFRTDASPEPVFNDLVELDLATVEPSMAGPRRPQDRVSLNGVAANFAKAYPVTTEADRPTPAVQIDGETTPLRDGAVAIAAITSCTNTSNPMVMVGAGLVAKKAVERGLRVNPTVKTSLAPGSRVVTDYLERAGLVPFLEALGFHLVGYGCTTCIGNSGPLREPVAQAVTENNLVVASVLSGNRNFEGRIHPQVRASYLASPPLVVAYALAGTVTKDLTKDPLGADHNGEPVYLRDIWPSQAEIHETIAAALGPDQFRHQYSKVLDGGDLWESLPVPAGALYEWDPDSTYVREPSFFENLSEERKIGDLTGARALAVLGDSVTTDHISPAGAIPKTSPAALYLNEHDVKPGDFNTYGARRGNHEVMVRGTFGNIRLRNALVPGREGDWTVHLPTGEVTRIFDASVRYQAAGTPLIIFAGKEYGSGSSRDWAAKGPMLLGVKAVIAETYERIHRSNLIGMGVLPLQFSPGESLAALGLDGTETFDLLGLAAGLSPKQEFQVRATRADGSEVSFAVHSRLDTPLEIDYYTQGGILPTVLKELLAQE